MNFPVCIHAFTLESYTAERSCAGFSSVSVAYIKMCYLQQTSMRRCVPFTLYSYFRNIGVISYMLLTQESPFVGADNQETFLNISQVNVDYSEETFSSVSQPAKDFIQKLLIKNPE